MEILIFYPLPTTSINSFTNVGFHYHHQPLPEKRVWQTHETHVALLCALSVFKFSAARKAGEFSAMLNTNKAMQGARVELAHPFLPFQIDRGLQS